MIHAYVRRFDVMGTVEKSLKTKQGQTASGINVSCIRFIYVLAMNHQSVLLFCKSHAGLYSREVSSDVDQLDKLKSGWPELV